MPMSVRISTHVATRTSESESCQCPKGHVGHLQVVTKLFDQNSRIFDPTNIIDP